MRTYSLDQPSSLDRARMVVMLHPCPAQIRSDRSTTVSPFQHVRSARPPWRGPREGSPAVVDGWSDLRHFPSFYPDFQEARRHGCRAGALEIRWAETEPLDPWRTALEGSGSGGEVNGDLGARLLRGPGR